MPALMSVSRSKPMPVTRLPAKPGAQPPEGVGVLVDDRDRVALLLQGHRQRGPDAAAAHDHDVHAPCSFRVDPAVDTTRFPRRAPHTLNRVNPNRRTPDRRRNRPRPPAGSGRPDATGRVVELVVGPPAHGGSCVARLDSLVVFVRHALPGERVRARVTEGREGDRFWRADAVEVLEASPDRVTPPCPHAGPGACGGCDWQHASLDGAAAAEGDRDRRTAAPGRWDRPGGRGRGTARAGRRWRVAHPGPLRRRRGRPGRASAAPVASGRDHLQLPRSRTRRCRPPAC